MKMHSVTLSILWLLMADFSIPTKGLNIADLAKAIEWEHFNVICLFLDEDEDFMGSAVVEILSLNHNVSSVSLNSIQDCRVSSSYDLILTVPSYLRRLKDHLAATILIYNHANPKGNITDLVQDFPLTFSSRVFEARDTSSGSLLFGEYYKTRPHFPVISKACPAHFRLTDSVWQHRKSLEGIELRIVYEYWSPYSFFTDENAPPEGIIKDIIELLEESLNFTTRYIKNPEAYIWGQQTENGSFSGMIGQVSRGEADASIAGFVNTLERSRGVDFTQHVAKSVTTLFVARDTAVQQINAVAFTSELAALTWAIYFLTAAASLVVVFLLLVTSLHSGEIPCLEKISLQKAADVIYRAMLNMRTEQPVHCMSRLSWRLGLFTIFLGQFCLFANYRSAMNAFLTVEAMRNPIETFKDIYESDYGVMLYKDSAQEAILRKAPLDSYAGRLYNKLFVKNNPEKRRLYFSSFNDSVQRMLEENVLLLDGEEGIIETPQYQACKLTKLTKEPLPVLELSIPLTKGSSFLEPFNLEISKMHETGVIAKI